MHLAVGILCMVINGAKTDIGKISKILIRRIMEEVLPHTGLNLWKSTPEVLTWFNKIKDNLSKIKTRKFGDFEAMLFNIFGCLSEFESYLVHLK